MTPEELLVEELRNEKEAAMQQADELMKNANLARERAFAYDRAADKVESFFRKAKKQEDGSKS